MDIFSIKLPNGKYAILHELPGGEIKSFSVRSERGGSTHLTAFDTKQEADAQIQEILLQVKKGIQTKMARFQGELEKVNQKIT